MFKKSFKKLLTLLSCFGNMRSHTETKTQAT
jgi:hypothetical protein